MKLCYQIVEPKKENFDIFSSFVREMDSNFIPSISSRVNIDNYILKMYENATIFKITSEDKIIACNVVYVNEGKDAFATFLAVRPEYENFGLGAKLIYKALRFCEEKGCLFYSLKMRISNKVMYDFYIRLGFDKIKVTKYPNSNEYEVELVKKIN